MRTVAQKLARSLKLSNVDLERCLAVFHTPSTFLGKKASSLVKSLIKLLEDFSRKSHFKIIETISWYISMDYLSQL